MPFGIGRSGRGTPPRLPGSAPCGLGSAYHAFFGCGQGAERHGTWYNHKRIERSFHLDYCFVPRNWLPHVYRVEVGRPHAWLAYSDHCPLIVDVAMVDAA